MKLIALLLTYRNEAAGALKMGKLTAKSISFCVRCVLRTNDMKLKQLHMNRLERLVGVNNARRLIKLKMLDKTPLESLDRNFKQFLIQEKFRFSMRNGKAVVCVFGKYIPIFIY